MATHPNLMFLPLLFGVTVASYAASEDPVRRLVLFDFETEGGSINVGGEFPGAQGKFVISADAAREGKRGGQLSFDLTRGNYIAWMHHPSRPLADGARTISLSVRTHAAGQQLHCKTRDITGQEHIRFLPAPPAGQWARVSFDVDSINGHWGGANDGKIHWPIVLIQIGVEARGQQRVSHIDFDTLAIDTSASRHVQPGASLRVESDTFGHLYHSGEVPSFSLHARGVEQRPNQEFAGTYTVRDSWDRKVAQGSLDSFHVNYGEEAKQDLKLNVSGFGAFCLDVDLQNHQDPSEHLHMRSWFGVLPGPTPPPCRWAGTGIHAGHGWAQGDLRFLDILTAAGIGVVREEFGWSGVERTKGEYAVSPQAEAFVDGLAERGIRLNLLLTYGNPIHENPLDPDAYSRWAAWMARHFDGRVRDFEIWNEPHNFQFRKHYGGDVSGNAPWIGKFVELSLKAGAAIRDVRPDANIIICSEDVWPTLRQMLQEGIGPAGNVISIHPYCHGQPRPEREVFLRDGVKELRQTSREHGGPERVVITESGWTTYEGDIEYLEIVGGYPRSSYMHQAQYIIRMFLTARAVGADYAIQYDFRNDGNRRTHTEHNFGLVHEDYSPKPSLMAVAAMTRILGQGRFLKDLSPAPNKTRAYVFDVNGKPIVAAYAIEGSARLKLETGVGEVEIADLMGNRQPLATADGALQLDLTETPVYVLGTVRAVLLQNSP